MCLSNFFYSGFMFLPDIFSGRNNRGRGNAGKRGSSSSESAQKKQSQSSSQHAGRGGGAGRGNRGRGGGNSNRGKNSKQSGRFCYFFHVCVKISIFDCNGIVYFNLFVVS